MWIHTRRRITRGFICPVCKSPASVFVKVEEKTEVDDKEDNKSKSTNESSNKYKGTKTEKNLMDALAGESIARNKYTFFADVAKNEGYEQIYKLNLKTAGNERGMLNYGLKN